MPTWEERLKALQDLLEVTENEEDRKKIEEEIDYHYYCRDIDDISEESIEQAKPTVTTALKKPVLH